MYMIVKSECLGYLFQYHNTHNSKRRAVLTVLQQVNTAELVYVHFHQVCISPSPADMISRGGIMSHQLKLYVKM